MSDQQRSLPLFPLGSLLFPNATMPLRIFEERYKLMMQRCLDGDSEFGVVLIKSGAEVGEPAEPHPIGTVAHITQTAPLSEGYLLVAIVGRSRFLIREITQKRPYLEGVVEMLLDEDSVAMDETELGEVRGAATEYVSLMAGLSGGWVREAPLPADPTALSYYLPGLMQVDPLEKQHLLEEPTARGRLAAELQLLRRETTGLRERVQRQLGGQAFGRN